MYTPTQNAYPVLPCCVCGEGTALDGVETGVGGGGRVDTCQHNNILIYTHNLIIHSLIRKAGI